VLTLQLKRYDHRMALGQMTKPTAPGAASVGATPSQPNKITMMIQFPLDLDLYPYSTTGLESSIPTKQNSNYMYTLYSVIVHHGTLNSGHYTCYIRKSGVVDQWFRFNDHIVTAVDWDEVRVCQAYMLFYIKKSFEYM
jgi:ubiquitin carboxyl-terminal hydrolase 22/27/51